MNMAINLYKHYKDIEDFIKDLQEKYENPMYDTVDTILNLSDINKILEWFTELKFKLKNEDFFKYNLKTILLGEKEIQSFSVENGTCTNKF